MVILSIIIVAPLVNYNSQSKIVELQRINLELNFLKKKKLLI